jgi:hypothetical protein
MPSSVAVRSGPFDEVVPDARGIQIARLESGECVIGGFHDGLTVVEIRIEYDGDPGDLVEVLDQRGKGRGGAGVDGLDAGSLVDVHDARDLVAFSGQTGGARSMNGEGTSR